MKRDIVYSFVTGVLSTILLELIMAGAMGKITGTSIYRRDLNGDNKKELCLEKISSQRKYIINEDKQGNITSISEFNGLEIKLGKTFQVYD